MSVMIRKEWFQMVFAEPKMEFVKIDMQNILTVSGTQGGDTCIGTEQDCGDTANTPTTCSLTTHTGPAFD